MPDASVDFSAQFGGRDAAQKVLPHFKALKAAGKDVLLREFPFEKLAFILRVDGSVSRYGLSGVGHVDARGTSYISLDIGIPEEITSGSDKTIAAHIITSLQAVPAFLTNHSAAVARGLDISAVENGIAQIIQVYEQGQ